MSETVENLKDKVFEAIISLMKEKNYCVDDVFTFTGDNCIGELNSAMISMCRHYVTLKIYHPEGSTSIDVYRIVPIITGDAVNLVPVMEFSDGLDDGMLYDIRNSKFRTRKAIPKEEDILSDRSE